MQPKKTYGEILKSSTIMGGAAGFVMLIGFVRTKFAAILIGTTGVGLLSGFLSIQTLISTLAGLGLASSGVREIAVAANNRDQKTIDVIVFTMRRITWSVGLLGGGLLLIFSPLISNFTFGSEEYSIDIGLLSVAVLLSNLSGVHLAVLQGFRRVGDMAHASAYGAGIGAMIALLLYYYVGLHGIALALVGGSCVQYTVARYYTSKLSINPVKQTWGETFVKGRSMIGLGLSLMWSTLLVSAVSYLTIYLINQFLSVRATGLYSAAFVASAAFVSFVLSAMASDFYPRLTSWIGNNEAMRSLVNEQIEIGLLLALPILLSGVVFAPWIVLVLYSEEFEPATPLLQWFMLGCFGRVLSFPMSFIMLAMGKGRLYLITETCINGLHALLVILGLWLVGIEGVSIAFSVLYFFYCMLMYFVSRKLIGFHWSSACVRIIVFSFALLAIGMTISRGIPLNVATGIGAVIVVIVGIVCVRELVKKIDNRNILIKIISNIPGGKLLAGIGKGQI